MTLVAPLAAGGGVEFIATISRDETERRRLEEQLRHSQKMEAIGRLAGGVAHDFNNLLTGIIGYAELALRRLPPADALAHDLEEIRKAGRRAADLTRQLLAFSRKQVLQPRVVDLGQLVADMEKLLRRVIGEDVDLRIPRPPILGRVRADPGQLEQVVMNLAVNARDAMPRGGTLTIAVGAAPADAGNAPKAGAPPSPFVALAVTDTGSGMTDEVKAHLFEPFFTTKAVGKGTGLGLSTVYGIVEQSGGRIEVESASGRGTTFRILLPRVEAEESPARDRPTRGEPPRGRETILLVEDEDPLRTLAGRVLRESGYAVLEARDGEEALRIASGLPAPPDLVVTDVVMPRLGGPDLAGRLAALWPALRFLYMTGYVAEETARRGLADPSRALLEKPFSPGALLARVRDVLDGRSGTR